VKTPLKVLLHDQEMAEQSANWTSILQIQLGVRQLEDDGNCYKRRRVIGEGIQKK